MGAQTGTRPPRASSISRSTSSLKGPERLAYIPTASQKLVQESRSESVIAPRGAGAFTGRQRDRSSSIAVRKQPRVCVLCDHCWYAEKSTRRSDVLKCPACLTDQPDDDEFTEAERAAMNETFETTREKVAERRKQLMAAASRARSSKPLLP
jgi:hypothetical protein